LEGVPNLQKSDAAFATWFDDTVSSHGFPACETWSR